MRPQNCWLEMKTGTNGLIGQNNIKEICPPTITSQIAGQPD